MGSGLITPLYELYRKAFGFSEITLTLIYAAYVVGNVAALLFFGRFSDVAGRRPVALASVGVGCISMLLFVFAQGTAWLFAGRVLSGVAVGLASGTGTAWLADILNDKSVASTVAAAANAFGFAFGPLAAGLAAQYSGAPLNVPFYVYFPLLIGAGVLIALARETAGARKEPIDASVFRPRVGVPQEILAQFFAPAVTAFGVFALVGFYAALVPTVLRQSLHQSGPAIGGLIVFELAFLAGCATLLARRADSRTLMLSALALLLPAIALLLLSESHRSMPLLILASALGALCWAFGIRGSLQVINEIAPADRRAEVASSYYIAGFVGNSIPVIGIGLITQASNGAIAGLTFGATIAAFAAAALFVGLRYGGSHYART